MEAELQERVESSQKQANHVVEICEQLKSTVDQLKTEQDSETRRFNGKHSGKGSKINVEVTPHVYVFSFFKHSVA